MRKSFNPLVRLAVIALSMSLFWSAGITLAAFGVSPPWVQNDLLLPGSTLEETIYLSRSDASQAMQAKVKISGDEEVIQWVSIPNENNLVMRPGEQIYPMPVRVQVPTDANPGTYKGAILVTLSSITKEDLGGGQVAIKLGANISVDLTVTTTEVTDYRVESVAVPPKVVSEPFSVDVAVKNTGNTDISNIDGSIEVYDRSGTDVIRTMAFVTPEEPIAFNETKEMEMVYGDFTPDAGEYWVQIKAVKDGETVYENRLLQSVTTEPVAVVTAKDALVQLETESQQEAIVTPKKANGLFLILGLVGLGLGLIALAVLRMVPTKKNRRRR